MKKTLDKKMFILALAFILIFVITKDYARGLGTFDILLIGTIISPNEKGNAKTYELWTKDKKCRFKATKAQNMGLANVSGWRILGDIFPRKIYLIGEESLIAPLKQPKILGKTFKLRGHLCVTKKTYDLNIVEEVKEKKSPEVEEVTEEKSTEYLKWEW